MAHLEALDARGASGIGAMESLYWWRTKAPQSDARERAGLSVARLAVIAGIAEPAADELPGNSMRERAARRRQQEPHRDDFRDAAAEVELLAAIRAEKTNARFAVATGILATTAPSAAAAYAVTIHHPVALGFAMAGVLAACFALGQAIRSLVAANALSVEDLAQPNA
jgi:hypothetical protein